MGKQKHNVQKSIQNIIINQIYFNTSLRRAYNPVGLITCGGAYKLGGCIFLFQALDGCSIKVTTIVELLLGG